MNFFSRCNWALAAFLVYTLYQVRGGDRIELQVQGPDTLNILQWRAQANRPVSGAFWRYEVEVSDDLVNWRSVDSPIDGSVGATAESLRMIVSGSSGNRFFRVKSTSEYAAGEEFADSIYGYADEFNRKIQEIGQIPLDAFVQRYAPTNEYLKSISYDPTTANYWPAFNLNPAIHNATNSADPRLTDFRFNPQELAVFRTNGFVVSQRLGTYSFADAFYRVYIDDLPVYVSVDAILHAWHRTYVTTLQEIEEAFLAPTLSDIIIAMQDKEASLYDYYSPTASDAIAMRQAILDADYFLAVAHSLLTGGLDPGRFGQIYPNQAARIAETLAAINSLSSQEIEFYGEVRRIDFSQFRVRGHYEESPVLQSYFKTMMWCSLSDFRFKHPRHSPSFQQFSAAIALNLLIADESRAKWMAFDEVVRTFVGPSDCMDLAQLGDLAQAANLVFGKVTDSQLWAAFQSLFAGSLGVQQIRSGYFYSPLGPEKIQLPRSFAMMPQRFLLDSWALSKVVYDDIIWDENGIPELKDKVERRVPSGLDVAFSVFGNDALVPEIAARIANRSGHQWRDGYPYQHNLAAVRGVIDGQESAAWTNNLYSSWLGCLRSLSKPATGSEYPEVMKTKAWALSTLNSQLASWTQLRHDTILYGKQSYTGIMVCGYPDGYVEPRIEFWERVQQMAERTKSLIREKISGEGVYFWSRDFEFKVLSMESMKTNWTEYFGRFSSAAGMLKSISEKELLQQDLTPEEKGFLRDIIELQTGYVSGPRMFSGWYPGLFYRPLTHSIPYRAFEGSDLWDPVVTDVHTDSASPAIGDPGSVLHEAVGNVHLAFITVNCADEPPKMYAGPVLSHYEFEQPIDTRKTDSEWKADIKAGRLPPQPEWTKPFLVPGVCALPPNL